MFIFFILTLFTLNLRIYQSLDVVFEESDEELRVVDQKFNSKLESTSFWTSPIFYYLLIYFILELLAAEKATIERVQHLQNEKKKHETLRSELSLECGKIQTNLQHQQELIENRDKQIRAMMKKNSIQGFSDNTPLTSKSVGGIF